MVDRMKHGCTADPTMPGTVDESTGPLITASTAPVGSDRPKPLWTVVGLYERGKYVHDTFVCYLSGVTAEEAKRFAEESNAARGDKIEVLACVAGGGVAHVFQRAASRCTCTPYNPEHDCPEHGLQVSGIKNGDGERR